MTTNDFHYSLSLLNTLYGINLQEDEFEEIGLVAYGLIGNKRVRVYKYCTSIDDCASDYSIELPCNCDLLEAVTTNFEDWQHTSNITPNGEFGSFEVEQYIENRKHFNDPLYPKGKYLRYERCGNTLIFDKPYKHINILYRGIELDDDGLPKLNDKEALAIATYCAYVSKFKEGILTNNPNIINLANQLKSQWLIQCDQARTPEHLTQNDIDEILDAKTNWDRKCYDKSFKIIK